MPLFTAPEKQFLQAIGGLAYANPFTPERIEFERRALGDEFVADKADWNVRYEGEHNHPNLARLLVRCENLLEQTRERIARQRNLPGREELALYEDLLLMTIYHRHRTAFDQLIHSGTEKSTRNQSAALFQQLSANIEHYVTFSDRRMPLSEATPHLFAGFFQIRRAFDNIFRLILGMSQPAVRLRAAVWESIFTHDMRRYRRVLYARMADFTTLVTGPSGTGKELVAQAIGLSRYIPFDELKGQFREDFAGTFYPVNLSALSPTLIESELFGHKRGSFTGAIADRQGWLEVCPPLGTVFLDEIGEVDAGIQVKLLRVLQSREFVRLGDTAPQQFRGKIIAATNRDLAEEMHCGRFRHDFYYRLCSDIVALPSLAERIRDNPDELPHLVAHLAQRAVGAEADDLAREVVAWIEQHVGRDYAWPGNVRELEQCLRNVLIRKVYRHQSPAQSVGADRHDELAGAMLSGELTADELLRRYCTLVFQDTGSFEATARKLKLDRRTVRAKVDPAVVAKDLIRRGSRPVHPQ
jgi:transcriptional regulator with PAS, ATPase and Fis domain